LATNTDSSPTLLAGLVTPLVYVQPYGIVELATGVNPLSVPLNVSSLSLNQGGNNGGYLINLIGSGFPSVNSQISITICGNVATIQSTNNIKVVFYVPSCPSLGNQTVNVTVGSLTDTSQTFNYLNGSLLAPTIISLTPASANPGLKGTITINGENFGNDTSAVQIFLANATGKIYQLPILTISNTSILAGLPGGNSGSFILQVSLPNGNGDSIAATINSNVFNYVFSVSSISPTTGSYYGGTLLTITG
jgi:hypothetical protein